MTQVQADAAREKRAVALSSVLAAVGLTAFKLVVGLLSNSLGILSEAAHSGLDLVAALVTYLAVRVSDRPADQDHHFGHGKVENLSALIETLLLLGICGWIVYEAGRRLLFEPMHVEASVWAFVVMGVSIGVDIGRSRALLHAAQKHHSQALEADALHFQTDIWSSAVVIVGLGLVRLAEVLPPTWGWLVQADAVAAIIVAGIVVGVSVRLGRRTLDALLDRAPAGLAERIGERIRAVEHVRACDRVRLRTAGPTTFVEATVRLDPGLPTALAHQVVQRVQEAVVAEWPRTEVAVLVEPADLAPEDIRGRIHLLADRLGLSVHDLHIYRMPDGYHVDLDLEVAGDLSLEEAHRVATQFESLQRELPQIAGGETHIEVAAVGPQGKGTEVTADYGDLVAQVQAAAEACEDVSHCHDVRVRQVAGDLYVSLHCTCPGDLPMEEAHRRTAQLERRLHEALPEVAHFLVHIEPEDTA